MRELYADWGLTRGQTRGQTPTPNDKCQQAMTELQLAMSKARHQSTPPRREGLQTRANFSHFGVQLWPS